MRLAHALRNPQAQMGGGAMGGTQMPAQTGIPAMQSYDTPEFTGVNEGMNKDLGNMAKEAGQWAKDNYFAGSQADGMAQAGAAQQYGPEVAKMGGSMAPATNENNRGFGGMWDDAMSAGGGMVGKGGTLDSIRESIGGLPTGLGVLAKNIQNMPTLFGGLFK